MQTAMAELLALLQPYRKLLLRLLFSQPFPAQKEPRSPTEFCRPISEAQHVEALGRQGVLQSKSNGIRQQPLQIRLSGCGKVELGTKALRIAQVSASKSSSGPTF